MWKGKWNWKWNREGEKGGRVRIGGREEENQERGREEKGRKNASFFMYFYKQKISR